VVPWNHEEAIPGKPGLVQNRREEVCGPLEFLAPTPIGDVAREADGINGAVIEYIL
jgi:hypothetical protein